MSPTSHIYDELCHPLIFIVCQQLHCTRQSFGECDKIRGPEVSRVMLAGESPVLDVVLQGTTRTSQIGVVSNFDGTTTFIVHPGVDHVSFVWATFCRARDFQLHVLDCATHYGHGTVEQYDLAEIESTAPCD